MNLLINPDRTLIVSGALAVITVPKILSKSLKNLRDPFLDLLERIIYTRIVCSHGILVVLALDETVMVA